MSSSNPAVTRTSSVWLMAAQVMVLLPVWDVVPLPVILVGVLVLFWRITLWFGRGVWPPGWLRLLLVVFAFVSVGVSFSPLISLESAVSVLAAGYSLKLLEMRNRRDALVVVYIGFFVVATSVLYSQTLLQTLYLLACLVVLIAAQQGLYRQSAQMPVIHSVRYGALLVVQAVPLTVLFFLLVPRIGPLWSVPLPDHSARTGLSDSMSPGDIARLSRSDELAFRARFNGDVPPVSQRYWRAVVMDRFDGITWSQTDYKSLLARGVNLLQWRSTQPVKEGWWQLEQTSYDYEIMMEPTGRPWLFTLGAPGLPVEDGFMLRTMRLESSVPVNERKLYKPGSGRPVDKSLTLPEWLKQINLQLPGEGNPRSRLLAEQILAQAGGDPVKMAGSLMAMFARQSFFYTLSPPLLGENPVDEFLLDSRRGFCAHYAGAFVFLMRAAGIPARVVGGYQGGEYKPEENLIQVRQFDAHAWTEIWVEGQGWLRFDPTAAVSPVRIESGLQAALGAERDFLADSPLSLYRFRGVSALNRLRLAYENIEYQWQRSVINYRGERQEAFLRSLLGDRDYYLRLAMMLGGGIFVIIGLLSFLLLYRRNRVDPLVALHRSFCRKLSRQGFDRQHGEGVLTFAQRIARQNPGMSEAVLGFTEAYIQVGYADRTQISDGQIRKLKGLLRRL